ncbi:MAG: hypothetical protein Q9215_002468 [Flavoplaca cf. flavocitrina]
MPSVTKRRKTDPVAVNNKIITSALSKQQSIQAFGKVSKSLPGKPPAGKSKAKSIKKPQPAVTIPGVAEKPCAGRKRKVQDSDKDLDAQSTAPKRTKSNTEADSVLTAQLEAPIAKNVLQPRTPRKKTLFKSITIETPTKGACSYLESLDLSSSPSSERSSRSATRADTPASSPPPQSERQSSPDLPGELQDLIDLHSSFLTALSLHYAHHSSLTPVDFRQLRPNIERSWGKRKVSIQDIQRIIAFQVDISTGVATLSLTDYGHSKICIEISANPKSISLHKRPLNEEALNKVFIENLLDKWKTYKNSHQAPAVEVEFINSIPLAPITTCASASTLAPLIAKGQRRLEDLKAGAIRAQARSSPSRPSDKENIPPQAIDPAIKQKETSTRKTNLLDRIKAKQEANLLFAANSTLLTPEQVLRQRGLRRLEEIIPVLDLLGSAGGSAIKSFTMPTIVQHFQMSLRNPIEKEEAVRAVRLLAEEVAPGWIGVQEVGKLIGVTVRRIGAVGGREKVKGTVKRLIEGVQGL